MTREAFDHQTVVIGAGAAGVGATRMLAAAGRDCLIVEARDRVGGRTWTTSERLGYPVDHGGQWFHSAATNPLVPLAEAAGLTVVRQDEDWGGTNARFVVSHEHIASIDEALHDFLVAAYDSGVEHQDDHSLGEIAVDPRWRGLVRAIVTHHWGAFPQAISIVDQQRDRSSWEDWPIPEGMGTLIAGLADGLPVRTGVAVNAIDWSGPGVQVVTDKGTIRAQTVLVTVSTNVLASSAITFNPELPDSKLDALAKLPQGANEKVLAPLRPGSFADLTGVFAYSSLTSEDGCHLQVRPFGRDYVMAYLGADKAIEMAGASDEAATAYLTETLVSLLGSSARDAVLPGFTTRWQTDPWSLGAYSYARPGVGDARDQLAAPLANRLFFAGEATNAAAPSTVHGAFLSGERAAGEVLDTLAKR